MGRAWPAVISLLSTLCSQATATWFGRWQGLPLSAPLPNLRQRSGMTIPPRHFLWPGGPKPRTSAHLEATSRQITWHFLTPEGVVRGSFWIPQTPSGSPQPRWGVVVDLKVSGAPPGGGGLCQTSLSSCSKTQVGRRVCADH